MISDRLEEQSNNNGDVENVKAHQGSIIVYEYIWIITIFKENSE